MRDIMLIVHFIGLAMGLGTSFAHLFLGKAAARMDAADARKFRLQSFALNNMGHIGLALLIISGGYLMTPYWNMLPASPMLIAKLSLVLVLGALLGIISAKVRKARQGDADTHLRKIAPLGRIALVTTVVIIVLAVYVFH
ncbi:MAG: hypothetical protein KFH87_05365 [Bacteroidetes bacterium]|nr:hypothetical protein [Bacteroidota bacterium]